MTPKITLHRCKHADFSDRCLSCVVDDELPDEIQILPDGKLRFITGDTTQIVDIWRFDGVRWVGRGKMAV